jgi:hypothetical protein
MRVCVHARVQPCTHAHVTLERMVGWYAHLDVRVDELLMTV